MNCWLYAFISALAASATALLAKFGVLGRLCLPHT